MQATYDPHDVNCFHGREGSRFVLEWYTEEAGQFGPEVLRYIETEVNPTYNGGYRFVFEDKYRTRVLYLPARNPKHKDRPERGAEEAERLLTSTGNRLARD